MTRWDPPNRPPGVLLPQCLSKLGPQPSCLECWGGGAVLAPADCSL